MSDFESEDLVAELERVETELRDSQESRQIWAEVAQRVVEACPCDRVQALVHVTAYIESLQAELARLRRIEKALVEIADERRTDTAWMKQRARAALADQPAEEKA